MKIFMSGATGVVGRRAVPLLVQAGHSVSAVTRSSRKATLAERAGARPVFVDLFDGDALARAVAGHEVVINLATHIPASSTRLLMPGAWRENDRLRREGAALLAQAAAGAGAARYVQESFAPAYPDCGERWIDEDTPLAPVRYNRSILDAERAAARFGSGAGTAVVLRFAAFYGADAFQTREMIEWVRKGRAPLPGAAGAYLSSVSHDDAASAVVAALRAPSGTYNVCDDEPLTRRDFFDALAQVLEVPPPRLPPRWMTLLLGSLGELLARSQRMSNRKLATATGWTPRYPSVREGWRALPLDATQAKQGVLQ